MKDEHKLRGLNLTQKNLNEHNINARIIHFAVHQSPAELAATNPRFSK